ncbi:hypothetical protein ACHAWC_011859 [Mediolabrus comicus]
MINGNEDDPTYQHPAICDSDSECDEDHNYRNNDTEYGELDVPDEEINHNNFLYNLLLACPFITNGEGAGLDALAFNLRVPLPGMGNLQGMIENFFDQLPSWVQSLIGNLNPAQSCVLYITEDVVHHFKNEFGGLFGEGDVEDLTASELLNAAANGLFPVGKTLTKICGENSLLKMVGLRGKTTKLKAVNSQYATLIRSGVFTAITFKGDRKSWDGITISENAEQKIGDGIAEAARRHRLRFPFSIRDIATGDLLKKVVGSRALYALLRQDDATTRGIVNQIYSLADQGNYGEAIPTYKYEDGATGNEICLLTIEGMPEGCEDEPVDNAESRLAAIHQRYESRRRRAGNKPAEMFFLIYSNNRGEPGELLDKVQGPKGVSNKMGNTKHWRTGIAESTEIREGGRGPMVPSTKALWEQHEQLYNGHADKWVVKVNRSEYFSAVVPE